MQTPQPISAARLPDALLTLQTVCAVTGLDQRFIQRATSQNQFPAPARIGNSLQRRWHSADVRAWIAAQRPAAPKVAA